MRLHSRRFDRHSSPQGPHRRLGQPLTEVELARMAANATVVTTKSHEYDTDALRVSFHLFVMNRKTVECCLQSLHHALFVVITVVVRSTMYISRARSNNVL